MLMYLTDVEAGGETVFPHVPKAPHQTLANGWSNCSLQVSMLPFSVAPKLRRELPTNTAATVSLHAADSASKSREQHT